MIHDPQVRRSPDAMLWLAGPRAAALFDPTQLSAEDAVRWRFVRTERRRLDFQASRALLQHTGDRDRRGSLSHSRGFVALLLPASPAAQSLQWGVDLELRRPRRTRSVCEAAFHADEAAFVASDPARMDERFHILWTLKEAFAKAVNAPLFEALSQCRVETNDPWRLHSPDARQCCAVTLSFADRTVSVVCVGARAPLHVVLCGWPEAAGSGFMEISVEPAEGAARLRLVNPGADAHAAVAAPPAASLGTAPSGAPAQRVQDS
jgi:hypothetical protein